MAKQEDNWLKDWILKAAGTKKKKNHKALHDEDDPSNIFKEINSLRKGGADDAEDEEARERAKYSEGFMGQIAKSKVFEFSTLGMICFNALAIGYDTNYTAMYGKPANLLDGPMGFIVIENMFCTYFTAEVLIRFLAYKKKCNVIFDAWFVFDSFLVTMMVIETWVLPFIGTGGPLGNLSIFRLLRLLRITRISRLMRAVPEIMVIIKGMVASTRTVCCTGALLMLVLYTFCILFTDAYHEKEWPDGKPAGIDNIEANFGTMGKSMFSLFIYGTVLDDVTACADSIRATDNIWMMAAFVMFILISSFMMLNMLIGILVEVVGATAAGEKSQAVETRVREAIRNIFDRMDQDSNKEISRGEFLAMRKDKNVMAALEDLDIMSNHFHLYAELFFRPEAGSAQVPSLNFEQLVGMMLRLTPGSFVSALDFAAFAKTITGIHDKVKDRVCHLEDLCEKLAEPDGFANLTQLSLPDDPGTALPAPEGPPSGLAGDAVVTFDGETKADLSLPSVRNILSDYDRNRLERTTSTEIIEELQRRLGMADLEKTGEPYAMDDEGGLKAQAPDQSNQAFMMLGVPQDDNDSGTVYV